MRGLLGCLGLLCACGPAPASDAASGRVHGTVLTSWQPDQYRTPTTQRTVRDLADLGVDYVSVLATWYQSSVTSSDIAPDPARTPEDHAVEYALGEVRDRGMVTVLKPHLDLPDATWRGEITPEDPAAWFEAYQSFILHYAEMAQRQRVGWLVVGTELKGTEGDARWRDVIAAVREVYDGRLVYAANWDSYAAVAWWDDLDMVGVDAYFPLTSGYDPSPGDLRAAWAGIHADLEAFADEVDRELVLTEVGYQARDGANVSPWWAPTTRSDTGEQVACLDAMLQAVNGGDRVVGAFLWKTFYDPARDEDDFDVLYRPAEQVVRDAWAR